MMVTFPFHLKKVVKTHTRIKFSLERLKADDTDGLAGNEEELTKLAKCLDKTSAVYGMEIRVDKTKLMTSNIYSISTDVRFNGKKLRLSRASDILEQYQVRIQARNTL